VAQPGGAPLELDLTATGPGRYEGSFPIGGPGTYIVRVDQQREGASAGAAEAGMPVSYPAEFRQVTADTRRLEQIARAGGGHVLASPAAAFADDLAPVTTPLPLQRTLLLIAALLLPLEIAVRKLRISPADIFEWLRHPRKVEFAIPWQPAEATWRPGGWAPGMWGPRRPPAAVTRAVRREQAFSANVTPGLAREEVDADASGEEDALGVTLKWLAARRGSRGDKG
jgi:hypothetical protein